MHDASGGEFHAATLRSHAEFQAAAELYARVFGYDSPDLQLNTNLLSALVRNGGSAVGVRADDGRLVGFAYGFAGRDASGHEFHYSQAAVVDAAHQGAGIGRLLKQEQRRVALSWGHRRMRWTFDPRLARNAHFNFSSLGAEGVAYVDDYYDRPATDRIVVDWVLDRADDPYAAARRLTPPPFDTADWGHPVPVSTEDGADAVWMPVPAQAVPCDDELRAAIHDGLRAALADDRVLVACTRTTPTTSAYLAVRRLDEEQA
jgi:predicted GNAT superfamily acetyltransferase